MRRIQCTVALRCGRHRQGPGKCDKEHRTARSKDRPPADSPARKQGSHSCKHKKPISTDNLTELGSTFFPRAPGGSTTLLTCCLGPSEAHVRLLTYKLWVGQ